MNRVSSNIDCHFNSGGKKKKSHKTCDRIGFTTKQFNQEGQMERLKSITPLVCRHSHFKHEERLQWEFYLHGKGSRMKNDVLLYRRPYSSRAWLSILKLFDLDSFD